jgi:hypothetical protein
VAGKVVSAPAIHPPEHCASLAAGINASKRKNEKKKDSLFIGKDF